MQSIIWPSLAAASSLTLLVVHVLYNLRHNHANKTTSDDKDIINHHFSRSSLPVSDKAVPSSSTMPDVDDVRSSPPPSYSEALSCPITSSRPLNRSADTMAPVGCNTIDLPSINPRLPEQRGSVDVNDEIHLELTTSPDEALQSRNLLVVGSLPPLRHMVPLPPIRARPTYTGHQ